MPNSTQPATAYIYGLSDPRRPGDVRYIGKTVYVPTERLRKHIVSMRQGSAYHSHRWMRKLDSDGVMPIVQVLAVVPVEQAYDLEIAVIAEFRRHGFRLTNGTVGGDGFRGVTHTAETREKLRVSHIGKKLTEEQRARIAEGNKASWLNPDVRIKRLIAMTGRPCSEETKKKISEAQKGRRVPDWKRRAISASLIGKKHSPETIAKRSASQRVAFAKPEVKEKLRNRPNWRRNVISLSGSEKGNPNG